MEGDCDGIIGDGGCDTSGSGDDDRDAGGDDDCNTGGDDDGHVGDDQAPFNSLLAMQCLNDAVFQFSMF